MLLDRIQSSANTLAEITYAAGENVVHTIYAIYYGYAGGTTSGGIVILVDAVVKLRVPVTATGAGFLPFPPVSFNRGAAVVVRIEAGGASVVGDLNVLHAANP